MAITKDQKKKLVAQYVEDLNAANNTVIMKQTGIEVPESTSIRKDLAPVEGKFNVIRKRLFLIALKEAGFDDIDPAALDGALAVLYAKGDEFAPLKAINKYAKEYKKDEEGKAEITFLWGWFEKKRKDAEHVNELANIPSKEELLSKLAWLLNYPLQSIASVLDKIAEKKAEWAPKVEEKKEEPKAEEKKEEAKEEKKEEVKEEPKAEEKKEEVKEEVKEEPKEEEKKEEAPAEEKKEEPKAE